MATPLPTITVRGACPHDCPDTCALLVDVDPASGRAVGLRGDPDHPITRGWLCAKVRPYLDRVYDPSRLTVPLRRAGAKGEGRWQEIGWDEAIAEIAARWQGIIAADGAAAILPYSFSGTLGQVQNAVVAERFWNRMGASGLERSICGAAHEQVVRMTLGAKLGVDYRDVLHSRLVVVWGHNPVSTAPHFMPFLREAQHNGTRLVVIDPRRTSTARGADLHIRPRPSTDAALALGMVNVIFAEGLHDEAWLEAHSVGWRELRDRAAEFPLDRVEAVTGVPAEQVRELAVLWATTTPALLKSADGIQRHGNGGQTVRALLTLPAVTGQYGVRGGGLAYSTGDYVRWDAEAFTHRGECPPPPRVVNMNRIGAALTGEVSDPPIRSLYVFNANPLAAAPNSARTLAGLQREDLFTVVHEQFMTDTARWADIVLPATSQLEQVDLHRPYGGNLNLQYNHAAIAPLGQCKSNWDVMRLLAAAMGYDEPWLRQDVDEVIAEILEASRPNSPALAEVTLERLQAEGTVPYALPEPRWVPFSDGVFPTPSGKVELRCDRMAKFGLDPLPDWAEPAEFAARAAFGDGPDAPLVLVSGAPHHFVSTSFANQPGLVAKEGVPHVEIHPDDAAARGIADGDEVIVENARGWCRLRAVVTDDVIPGVAVAPKGRWPSLSPDGRTVNWTAPDAVADLAGQSTFHSNLVAIRPVGPADAPAAEAAAMAVAD